MNVDRIAKQRLNIILLVDASTSMRGDRISQVNKAIGDIKNFLIKEQAENTNVDFYITLLTFSTTCELYKGKEMCNVNEFEYDGIKAGGWSNLNCAYEKLGQLLRKESKGGIMPDYGGLAPIILLLTDGHPTGKAYKDELKYLSTLSWYKVALKYGVAIEQNDNITLNCLREFVDGNGDVIECYDSNLLKRIIKIVVLTASKIKSTSIGLNRRGQVSQDEEIKKEIQESLVGDDEWEW